MSNTHDYPTHIVSTGLKTGELSSPPDRLPSIPVSSPPQFEGPEETWSPEHLFVAALSSCLMTTFRSIAHNSKLDVVEYSDDAVGELVRGEDRLYRIETVTLRPRIVISDPDKVDRAIRLINKAEKVCLVSRSVSSEIKLEPVIEVASKV